MFGCEVGRGVPTAPISLGNCYMNAPIVIANGEPVQIQLPCTVHDFLLEQHLLPRSVVVEHNGEALVPSEFAARELNAGDCLELVGIVAGG
jgi:sulfur carrier protein